MSPIQTVAVAVRLFAIWLAIYCARWAPYLYGVVIDAGDVATGAIAVGVVVMCIAAVLFLWFFPRTVARSLLSAGDLAALSNGRPEMWLSIGCTLLGLWVLTSAIPALVRSIYVFAYASRANMSAPEGWGAGMLYILVELAVALWLVLGASGLRKAVSWARNAGTE